MTTSLSSALNAIPAHDRDIWIRMGMALKSELGEGGYSIWNTWSSQAESYVERDARIAWRSFNDRPNGVTIGSLYKMARDHGWHGQPGPSPTPSPEAQRRRAKLAEEARRKRTRDQKDAARRARTMLLQASTVYPRQGKAPPHPYLAKKGFPDQSYLLENPETSKYVMYLPMRDYVSGALLSIQSIAADGDKRFLPGSRTKASVLRLGQGADRWYVEGYATGLSVQAALRYLSRPDQVVVCFSAHNLEYVARRTKIGRVIADNDQSGAGERAARATGLPYFLPNEIGDANDVMQNQGVEGLAREIRGMIL